MAHSGTIIDMQNVPGHPTLRRLTRPLICPNMDGTEDVIQPGFIWNGASSGIFKWFFPRHDHPLDTCKHDYRCSKAKNKAERKWADKQFKIGVGKTSGWWTKTKGYAGVRIGAFFGMGSNF